MTLKQIAQQIAVPESTLRLYRDEFNEFVPATGEGRRRRYNDAAAQTLHKIVEWKKAGTGANAIRQELARTQTPMERKNSATQDERIAQVLTVLGGQGSEIAMLRAEVGVLRSEMGRLIALLSADQSGAKTMEAVQRERLPG
ncbi:MAG: MerR family transcriptional regulator [Armatimonadetes bacterium]|nr:MerR family transcriptional regulator [Armatimonadota bacterium]